MFNRNHHHSCGCGARNCRNRPSQMMPSQFGPAQFSPQMMPSQLAPQMMPSQSDPSQLAPQVMPPQFSPQMQLVRTNVMHTIVPHVHPTHITTVNRHVIDHQHHFPVTESVVEECCENQTMCGTPHHHQCGKHPR